VSPPRSWPVKSKSLASPARVLYAVVASVCALFACASAECIAPDITIPGGKPVTAVPGETPTSPVMTLGPVLVTVVPARTAKLSALPNEGATGAALIMG
jgi:hypothetical protein